MPPEEQYSQLPLPLALEPVPTPRFANFIVGRNREVVTALKQWAADTGEWIYLHGVSGSGVSHLLLAATALAAELGEKVFYLDLADEQLNPDCLDGLDGFRHLVLDSLHARVGDEDWEEALFHLANRVRDAGHALAVGASAPPSELPIRLPDLRSRLQWAPCFAVHRLKDEDMLLALQGYCADKGLVLGQDAGQYLLRRGPRELRSLLAMIDRLDRESLIRKRPLTIPFIREVLGWQNLPSKKGNQGSEPHASGAE